MLPMSESLANGCAGPGKTPSGLHVKQTWVHFQFFLWLCVILGRLLKLSEPQFLYEWNAGRKTLLTRLL